MATKFGNWMLPRNNDVDRRRDPLPEATISSARKILSMLKFQERDQALPHLADNGGGDDVDTTLSLSIDSSRKSTSPPVLNPMPLRSVPPAANFREEEVTGVDSSASLSLGPLPLRANKRKRERKDVNTVKKRGKRNENVNVNVNGGGGEVPPPPVVPSIDEFPLLKQALEEKGVVPLFLYRKELEDSDVNGDLNRLFLTKREPLMKFLTAGEAADVDSGVGVPVLGVDECGKPYSLVLKKWPSMKITLINGADWKRLAAANAAKKGDFVEIWGFRWAGQLGLAVTFRRR